MLTKTKRLSILLSISLLLSACTSTDDKTKDKPKEEIGATLVDESNNNQEVDAKLKATLQSPDLAPIFENDFITIHYVQKLTDRNVDAIGSNVQLQYAFDNKTEKKQTIKFKNIKVDGKAYNPTDWSLQVPVDTEKTANLIFYKYENYKDTYEKEVPVPKFKKNLTADYTIIDYETSQVIDEGTFTHTFKKAKKEAGKDDKDKSKNE